MSIKPTVFFSILVRSKGAAWGFILYYKHKPLSFTVRLCVILNKGLGVMCNIKICIINRKCLSVPLSVGSSVRMGSGPLNTNRWKEIEQRFLHPKIDISLGKVNNKDSTIFDLTEAA